MRNGIELNIDGMPSFVKVEYHSKKYSTAKFQMDYVWNTKIDDLYLAVGILKNLGFTYDGVDYSSGYYGSVEDVCLDFSFTGNIYDRLLKKEDGAYSIR